MCLIESTITLFIAKVRVMAGEYSVIVVRRHSRHSRPVTQLLTWRTLILITAKQPHNISRKFTKSNRSEVYGKSLQRKPRHHQECACYSSKICYIIERSRPNVHRLNQMTVGHLMCSFRENSLDENRDTLEKVFGLHEHSFWILTDRLIARWHIGVPCHIWI